MLVLHRGIDQALILFDTVTKQCLRVVVIDTSKGSARIGIQGCESIQVIREELLLRDHVVPKYQEAARVYNQCYEDIDE